MDKKKGFNYIVLQRWINQYKLIEYQLCALLSTTSLQSNRGSIVQFQKATVWLEPSDTLVSKAKFQGKTAKCKLSPVVHDVTHGCVIRHGMNLRGQDGTMNLADWNGPWHEVTIPCIFAGEERTEEPEKSQVWRLKAERLEFSGEADESSGLGSSLRPVHSCSGLGPGLFIY